jgi:hypothetical protein
VVFQEIKREERVHRPEAKTGAAKPVATQSGPATPEAAATVSRDKEALARLLASF